MSTSAFWLFSVCLLSWPYRILINWKTGLLNYQIIKLFGNNNADTANADSSLNDERSNYTSNDDLIVGNHRNLPPSYSQAMLWPPTYAYLKQMLYEQADANSANQLDNENVNYVLDRIDKYQQTNQQQSMIEQTNCKRNTNASNDNQPQTNQCKARIPSSLSCSFLNGQIVYVVNTLRSTTSTSNAAEARGTSLDVPQVTTSDDCRSLMNANSRVQIISAGNLQETENSNLSFQIDSLNRALIIDEQDEHKFDKLNLLANSPNLMVNTYRNIPRSFTSENVSYLKRFSIRILRRIKSMQNIAQKPDVNV